MTALRILIIADDHFARAGLAALVQPEESLAVVGQIESSSDLQAAWDAYQPDVLLWDLGWESETMLKALVEWIDDSAPDAPSIEREFSVPSGAAQNPLLVLLAHENDAAQVWELGVRGLLLRTVDGDVLSAALNAVANGLVVLDSALSTLVTTSLDDADDVDEHIVEELIDPLTPRELEVLQLIAEGLPNKGIGRELGISEHTVKFHVNAILGKFNAASRTEAVVRATKAGLLLL